MKHLQQHRNLRFGYSSGVFFPNDTNIPSTISKLLRSNTDLVEINFATLDDLRFATQTTISLATQFKIRTIHAPMINIRYSKKSADTLEVLRQFAERIDAEYVLFHPDIVDDFETVSKKLGKFTAFENMDVRKSFGNTVADLEKVFTVCPEAKWVCDLNHVFTIDRSMRLSRDLHLAFADRLVGYHISGYRDEETLHTCFFLTEEAQILDAIEDDSKLLIHEGGAPDVNDFISKENDYLRDYFGL